MTCATEEKIYSLVDILVKRTRAGHVVWCETSEMDRFVTLLGSGAVHLCKTNSSSRPVGLREGVEIKITNANGVCIYNFSTISLGAVALYKLARGLALNVDEILGDMITAAKAATAPPTQLGHPPS